MKRSGRLGILMLLLMLLTQSFAVADEGVLTLPQGLHQIDSYAFENCAGIATVHIPENVETIGEYAFYGCGALSDLTLDEGVQTIGEKAFGMCAALKSVTLPSTLTHIDDTAFVGCDDLEIRAMLDTYAYDWAVANGYIAQDAPLSVTRAGSEGGVTLENGVFVWTGIGCDGPRMGFHVIADSGWTVRAEGDWLEAYGQGEAQTYGSEWHTVYLYYSPNETGVAREATVTFTCQSMQVVWNVVQDSR